MNGFGGGGGGPSEKDDCEATRCPREAPLSSSGGNGGTGGAPPISDKGGRGGFGSRSCFEITGGSRAKTSCNMRKSSEMLGL